MNILTFDIEEWALAKAGGYGSAEKYAEYDRYLNKILDTLDERGFKGTFFCTGLMGTDFSDVVRLIHSRGHEVGCHSYKHTWLNKMTKEDVLEDTRTSLDALEQCIGEKIKSYRAPAFSIGKDNKWTFEILTKCGIKRDASIYPAERDFGGFAQFGQKCPTMVYCNHSLFKEFPICTTVLCGHEIAFSGGGYFRFFPLRFVKNQMAKSDYNMFYFHIADFIPEKCGLMSKESFEEYYKISGTLKNRYMRYIKTNMGKKNAFGKMMALIGSENFVNIEQADKMLNWDDAPSVSL